MVGPRTRQGGKRKAARELSHDFERQEEEEELIPFEDAGFVFSLIFNSRFLFICVADADFSPRDMNMHLGYNSDYPESALGPSRTSRSPTPENAWDELEPTLAPKATPVSISPTYKQTAKGARDKAGRIAPRDKDKARSPVSNPLITNTTAAAAAINNRPAARKKAGPRYPPSPPVPRITRARSRSMDPTPTIAKADKAKKGKREGRTYALVPVVENQADDQRDNDIEEEKLNGDLGDEQLEDELVDAGPSFAGAAVSGRTQTFEDEHVVDDLLNEEGGSTLILDAEPEFEDEDDAQTRHAFETADQNEHEHEDDVEDDVEDIGEGGGGLARRHSLNLSMNLEAIDRLQNRHKTRRGSRAPSVFASSSRSNLNMPMPPFEINGAPSLRSRPSIAPSSSDPNPSMISQLVTPVPLNRRTRSSRAAELIPQFPSPGTRARDVKEQKERESKHTPYEPPAGTRASAHKARRLTGDH